MAQQIKFVYLTQGEYESLGSNMSESILYFTSDTHRIYKGSDLYATTTYDQAVFEELVADSIMVDGTPVSLEGHKHDVSEIQNLDVGDKNVIEGIQVNGTTINPTNKVVNLSGLQKAYKLVNLSGNSLNIENFTVNSIKPTSTSKITITIPGKTTDNTIRDFMIRIDCSSYTPQIALQSGTEVVDYESTEDDWNVMESGRVNILSFTETNRGSGNTKFLVGKKTV